MIDEEEIEKLKIKELERISKCSNEKIMEQWCQLSDIVNAFPKYKKWKKENNWIDYGDIIFNLWKLIKDHPSIASFLQDKYKHIIVDEFQDNNYALSRIVEKIAEPNNSVTVVGDDDQCIYAFRQANIQNINQFKSSPHLDFLGGN